MSAITAREVDFRLSSVESRTTKLEDDKADKDDLSDIAHEVRGLRASLTRLLIAITASAVIMSLTMIETIGTHVH